MAKKKIIHLSTFFPDCNACKYAEVVEFNLIQCHREKNRIPHPNCKVWKVPCVFFSDKYEKRRRDLARTLQVSNIEKPDNKKEHPKVHQ